MCFHAAHILSSLLDTDCRPPDRVLHLTDCGLEPEDSLAEGCAQVQHAVVEPQVLAYRDKLAIALRLVSCCAPVPHAAQSFSCSFSCWGSPIMEFRGGTACISSAQGSYLAPGSWWW